MIKRSKGHIVTVTSLAGKMGFPLRSAYCASKHALHGFFETLAIELQNHGIHITLAIPSHIRTNIDKNALNASGLPINKTDPSIQAGLSPKKCAKKIIKAIEHNKFQVFITGRDYLGYVLRQISPKLFFWLVKKLNLK
jgi:short-subunit dehydrogenase